MPGSRCALYSAALIAVATVLLATGCGENSESGDEGAIKVGQNVELSGFESFFGQSKMVGATAAVADINAQGGVEVDGEQREFELLVEDNRTNATTAVSAAEKLAEEGAILSFAPDQGFEGVYEIYKGANVITLGSGGPTVAALFDDPKGNPLLFNEFPLFDDFLGGHLQQIKYLYPEAKTIAALLPDDPNGQGFLPLFEELAPEYGFEFVGGEFHPPDEGGDFTPYLTSLKEKQPDVLYTGLFPQHSIPATEQAAELDAADIFTADFLLPQDLAQIDLRGHPAVLTQQTQVFADDFVPEGTEDLVKRLTDEAEGEDFLASLAVNAYVDIWLLKDAIETAGTADEADAIAEGLLSATYDGPFGPAKVEANHSFDLSVSLIDLTGAKAEVYTFPSILAPKPTARETVGN